MANHKYGSFALLITGAVTSGKTNLVYSIDDMLQKKYQRSIHFINEQSTGNYYKIIDTINPFKSPVVAYDHCWIQSKWFLFDALYKDWKIVVLAPSPELLDENYNKRLRESTDGDFSTMNPHTQQDEILSQIEQIKSQTTPERIKIFSLNAYSDYDAVAEYCFELIEKFITPT